jgi:hypothetical protein
MARAGQLKYLNINTTFNSSVLLNYRQTESAFWSTYLPTVIGHLVPTYAPFTEVSHDQDSKHTVVHSPKATSGVCAMLMTLPLFHLHIILICVVLVGAETATADCVLECDICVLTADCVGGHLLHPVEERKEVSQGKSTSLSSSTLYSVSVTSVLMGE